MKQNVGKAVKIAVLTVGAFVMIFPFLWMLFTSLKTLPESISIPPTLFPAVPQFENYTEALAVAPFGLYLRNSIIVAGGGTLLTLVLTVLSASSSRTSSRSPSWAGWTPFRALFCQRWPAVSISI